MKKEDIEILQKMLMKCIEFKPLLTPEQYKVYAKHLEEVIKLKENTKK